MCLFFVVQAVTCGDQYCYYLTSSKESWPEAVKQCRKFNADLVSIHNETENEWVVRNILTTQSLDEVHLGKSVQHYHIVKPYL